MDSEKLIFKQTLCRHWLLAGLYALGTLIVLWITVNRISEIPCRYYRYWQTIAGWIWLPLLYVYVNVLTFRLLQISRWARLMLIPSVICFLYAVEPESPTLQIANHLDCMSNQRAIALACLVYEDEFGTFPDSLKTLRDLELVEEKTLTCPGNPWHNPGDIDYLYFGKDFKSGGAGKNGILLTDRPENHRHKLKFQGKVYFPQVSTSDEQDFTP
ncbi:MAG: hypothetical protein IJS14_04555 [Lentisphaeria bacterium]|nr:hypothetical protein [Lentisphaeria bacterium]